jgi:ribose transport system permease protein
MFVAYSVTLPSTFFTHGNIIAMLASESFVLILAIAVTLPLRSGDFDLSIAAVMVFSSAVLGILTSQHHWPLVLAIVVTLMIGVVIGSVNAFFIVKLGINAFIVTLGMMTALGGLTYGITGSQIVTNLPSALVRMGQGSLFGLPDAVFYGWILAVIMWYVLEYTPYGRYLLFVGGNRDSSRLAGLRVGRLRSSAFISSALLSSVAGVVMAARIGAIDPSVGPSFLLPPYAAAFLGTTTIQIGRFNVVGTVVGSYFLTVGVTGLLLAGASPWVSDVFNGGALLVAVTFAKLASKNDPQ